MPSDQVVSNSTLYLKDDQGVVSTYVLANGSTHTLNNLVSGKTYTAYFSDYRLNNREHSLLLNGQKELLFAADKEKPFVPAITKGEGAIDTTGFKNISVHIQGLPVVTDIAVNLVHSDGDMYQHSVTSGKDTVYDAVKPGIYALQLPEIVIDGDTYRPQQEDTISIVEAGTLTFKYATSSIGGDLILAPYKNVSVNADWANGSMESLVNLAEKSGNKQFTLAFILGNEGDKQSCAALWGGQTQMSVASQWGKKAINDLRAIGGDVIISFGGASGWYLSQACQTTDDLYNEYKRVVDTYGVKHLDFDVEMGRENDTAAMNRMVSALVRLQKVIPDLHISFTLAAAPDIIRGFHVVEQAVAAGVEVDSVNPMTMSFGPWYHTAYVDDTAELSILTVEFLKGLMKKLYPALSDAELYQKMGMIPMQGINDQRVDHISLKQAERLALWSKQVGLRYLSYWAIDRDHPCSNEWASPTCSGALNGVPFQTESWQYSKEFLKYLD